MGHRSAVWEIIRWQKSSGGKTKAYDGGGGAALKKVHENE